MVRPSHTEKSKMIRKKILELTCCEYINHAGLYHKIMAVNPKNDHGETALHCACRYCHTDIVAKLLRRKGVDVNASCADGEVAHLWASPCDRVDVACI